MTLSLDGKTRHLRSFGEFSSSLDEVFSLKTGNENHVKAAWLALAQEGDAAPVSFLDVSANLNISLGGAVWFTGDAESERIRKETKSDIGDHFWVSEGDRVPEGDTTVFSDHYAPSYFDPRGLIPLDHLRKVIEEFFRTGGNRPNSVHWVAGNQNGTRFD
ncbi:Imm1 family immunity protein [Streptomyces sp. NPDC001744]|uniref:Imm1 family immunity protein n=1 Tax=Streptomyces sp. NPDC001744 TaxID=3364606 RepID=UPI0036801393